MILVTSVFALNVTSLLKAQKEADAVYKKTKNVYKPIDILRKANIDEAVENKPASLTAKQYADLLYDYAYLLVHTVDDTVRNKNQQKAEMILLQAKKYAPKDTRIQLLLARSYLIYFKFSRRTELGWGVNHRPYDTSWQLRLSPLMKKAYVEYVKLCKEQNIEPRLRDDEWLIVKRCRLFIEYYSTFSKKQLKYGPKAKPYKKGFENICSEYVAQLNKMPDDKYFQCSRYPTDNKGLFKIKPFITKDWRTEVNYYFVQYNNEQFIDYYDSLQLKKAQRYGGIPGSENNICLYQYVDFHSGVQGNEEGGCFDPKNHFLKPYDLNITKGDK